MGVGVSNIRTIKVNHCEASRAFHLHATLMRALRDDPALADDELFATFRAQAFDRFNRAFWEDGK